LVALIPVQKGITNDHLFNNSIFLETK